MVHLSYALILVLVMMFKFGTQPAHSASFQTIASSNKAQNRGQATPVYKMGTGDRVKIVVFGENDLSGEFKVSASGGVALPLIGQVLARGMTMRAFEHLIEKKLSDGYLKNPRVTAQVVSFRPFYIIGEVNKSGEYPYVSGMSLIKAIAMAEGFTYRANQKKIHITRARTGKRISVRVGDNIMIYPEDVIEVPERFF